jgi:hypothetical protein
MRHYCQQNLEDIKKLLVQLSNEQYNKESNLLSNATIGQHVRHILEFYQCLLEGLANNKINYDNRKRNLIIETNLDYAINVIDEINATLTIKNNDWPILLQGNYSNLEEDEIHINSSYFRELAYCLEHSIHHQALIKIGLIELDSIQLIDKSFGIAPATIRYKNQCVQ